VLHHLDLTRALPEMLRVLKPGGAFVFTEPNMLNPQIMLQKNFPPLKRLMGDSPDETAFFRWGIARELSRAGFSAPAVRPFDFLHPWVPGALAKSAERLGSFLERIPLLREIAGSLLITASK
jgi:SAM-dependent methyltransferase